MRILIIDDEIAALTKMKLLLASYGECALATNAGQGLQLVVKAIQGGSPFKRGERSSVGGVHAY